MSVEALSWAFARQDPPTTMAKFLLVSISNHADKAGVGYPGQELLAADCSCSPDTIWRNFAKLEALELVARFDRRRASGTRTSDWIVLAPNRSDRFPMIDANPDNYPPYVAAVACVLTSTDSKSADSRSGRHPTQSRGSREGEPSAPVGGSAPARARAGQFRVGGKPVNAEAWKVAVAALEVFNRVAGKKLSALDGTGQPSEVAKRVYSRVRAYPKLTAADHERIIVATLQSRWWGSDAPSIGVVYGPRAWDENMAGRTPTVASSRAAQDPEREARRARGRAAVDRLTGGEA